MLRGTVAATAITALALSAAPAASAEPLERWHDVDEGSDSFTCDDLAVDVAWSFEIHGVFEERGPDGFAYAVETRHGSASYSNAATGRAMTQASNFVIKDQQVTDNGDGTLTITVMAAGSDKYYGPDGKLLYNNPGQIRWQMLIDNASTPTDPFDDEFIADLGVVKGSTGRNDLAGRDFCDVLHEVIG